MEDEESKIQNLEKRTRRIENLHIWGIGIIVVGLFVFFLSTRKKGSDIGGGIEPPIAPTPPSSPV
jgi:hypothetical protein